MREHVIGSRNERVEHPRVHNVAELLFGSMSPDDAEAVVLLGCRRPPELRLVRLTLDQVRAETLRLWTRFEGLGIRPGQTVALLRFPRTDETVTALTYVALSALGVRVLFPMYLEMDAFRGWLELAGVQHVLGAVREVRHGGKQADVAVVAQVEAVVEAMGTPLRCFDADLGLRDVGGAPTPEVPWLEVPEVKRAIATTHLDTESLLLTTSGSSGASKLVRYTQGGYLRSCAAWEEAGMFAPELLGGPSLCLLLGHSMGLRALWNALWSRQPVCLITPEWFAEYPERVRSLLLEMRPVHVTGGPAVFDTVLELVRVFPDLKALFTRILRCAVSSGAPYNPDLEARVRRALGLKLHNALGLTETMQVACTVLGGEPPGLGAPLPGVRLRLVQEEGLPEGAWRLTLAAPFGFCGYLGRETDVEWFDTGDLVSLRDDGTVEYLGREKWDYLNDGLGVKLSRQRLQQVYAPLPHGVQAIDFVALENEPGLGALLYVGPRDGLDAGAVITEPALRHRLRSALEHRMDTMRTDLEEFEVRHMSVGRFAVIAADAERTRKGNIAWARLQARHAEAIARVRERPRGTPGVTTIDRTPYSRSTATRMTSPRRGALIELFGLDKHYQHGEGDRLTYVQNGEEREVWDFVGGFGANLLGHGNPRIQAALARATRNTVPILDQGSNRVEQADLAAKLARWVGDATDRSTIVRFGSTGSEAVEMALAHALLEREKRLRRFARDVRRRFGNRAPTRVRALLEELSARVDEQAPVLIALTGAFHGYSSAARSALGRTRDRLPFSPLSGIHTVFVDPQDPDAIPAVLAAHTLALPCLTEEGGVIVESTTPFSRVFAAIVEPVQGEGGIHPIPEATLRALSGHDFPLISDEIQAGLGRIGQRVAALPVEPDYLLVGKSLGGGVAKISALLVSRHRYVDRFDELYSSTFAGDATSSVVASEVLDILVDDDVCARALERGARLEEALRSVQRDFPQWVRDVRGIGLMWGVELDARAVQGSFLLRAVERRDLLGPLACAYLLNVHGLRVFPTLSAPNTLRIEPSAYVPDEAIAALATGLRALCAALEAGRTVELLSFLTEAEQGLPMDSSSSIPIPPFSTRLEVPAPGARRVGFINHFVLPEREMMMVEPTLGELSMAARRNLFDRVLRLMLFRPILAFARNLFDDRLWFVSIPVVADAATMEDLHRRNDRDLAIERLQEAVDLAASLGCEAVTLGGYTSILTLDGTALLPPEGCRVSSGNTFAVVVQARRIQDACAEHGIDPGATDTRVAVVGATGNIGSALASQLATTFRDMVLIAPRPDRLEPLAARIREGGVRVEVTTDLAAATTCNVVAIAVNTNDPLLFPQHLAADRTVLVADVSQPSVIARTVLALPHVHVLPQAGTVQLPSPADRDLVISSHTSPGHVFCCAAEAMLMGLEPERTAGFALTGPISPDQVHQLEELGDAHGLLHVEGQHLGFR